MSELNVGAGDKSGSLPNLGLPDLFVNLAPRATPSISASTQAGLSNQDVLRAERTPPFHVRPTFRDLFRADLLGLLDH